MNILLASLRGELLGAPCFLDRLTGLWRYDFGLPIDKLPGDQIALGTHMFTPVERLFDVLICAHQRLPQLKYQEYVNRLNDESRHQDALAEMIPLIALGADVHLDFEVPAETGRDRTIDWHLQPEAKPHVLFDVKNRVADLVEHLAQILSGQKVSEPKHDTALLFRNTVDKFAAHSPAECLHGVWLITQLKQEETELRNTFEALDATRLHFAVISNWKRECYLLTRDAVDRGRLLRILRLSESETLVFHRGHQG